MRRIFSLLPLFSLASSLVGKQLPTKKVAKVFAKPSFQNLHSYDTLLPALASNPSSSSHHVKIQSLQRVTKTLIHQSAHQRTSFTYTDLTNLEQIITHLATTISSLPPQSISTLTNDILQPLLRLFPLSEPIGNFATDVVLSSDPTTSSITDKFQVNVVCQLLSTPPIYPSLPLPFQFHPNLFDDSTINKKLDDNEIGFKSRKMLPSFSTSSPTVDFTERRKTAYLSSDLSITKPWRYGKLVSPLLPAPMPSSLLQVSKLVTSKISSSPSFDACLANLYPPGSSTGMSWHSDPDQGTLFDNFTAVASVGESALFKIRPTLEKTSYNSSNNDVVKLCVFGGDVVVMFDDCQKLFEHCIDDRKIGLRKESSGGGESGFSCFQKKFINIENVKYLS